jgi:hypothetical protein
MLQSPAPVGKPVLRVVVRANSNVDESQQKVTKDRGASSQRPRGDAHVIRLGLSPSLLRTFKSTNPIESMISVGQDRGRQRQALGNGEMVLRWTEAGVLEAQKQVRRVNGCRDLQLLRLARHATQPPPHLARATPRGHR